MRPIYYILEGREIKQANGPEWAKWFENFETRIVQQTDIWPDDNGCHVSTVFLGIDHNHWDKGPPILFESMIFDGPHDGWQDRYATYDAAEAGHNRVVSNILNGLHPDDGRDA